MEYRAGQVNVTKVARALRHTFTTRLTLVVPVDGTQARVRETAHLVFSSGIVLHLRVLDFAHRKGSLLGLSMPFTQKHPQFPPDSEFRIEPRAPNGPARRKAQIDVQSSYKYEIMRALLTMSAGRVGNPR